MLRATHSGGLGIYTNEMQRTINGVNGIIPYDHWQPYRPDSITRGLGDVPNDFEASVDLQYIPVRQGWYYGYPINGGGYPTMQCVPPRGGLGDAASDTATVELAKMERIQTILQVISTLSIAAVATLAVLRAVQGRSKNGYKQPFLGDDDDDMAW